MSENPYEAPPRKHRWLHFLGALVISVVAVAMTYVTLVIGCIAYSQEKRNEAQRAAYRKAIQEGRLKPEDGRFLLGDEVDRLKTPTRPATQ